MASDKLQALRSFFIQFGSHPSLQTVAEEWRRMTVAERNNERTASLIKLIDSATLFLEQEMQRSAYPQHLLDLHQQLFLEMESLIADQREDNRNRFIIVIPVADRPQQLQNCLESLYKLCRRFAYGGFSRQKYQKISVLIADDSKHPNNRDWIRNLQQRFTQLGLETLYFAQDEQLRQLDNLSSTQREALAGIVGSHPASAFHHKGASITRNISYLKLKQLLTVDKQTLIWFIDSDQEFRINTQRHYEGLYAINYFHRIDRIFSTTDTLVLTGKVVGDPPVSPAVMAANFLQDVLGFVIDTTTLGPDQSCRFHQHPNLWGGDAAYHDMADLFGFHERPDTFRYQCRLQGQHDHLACVSDFSNLLNRFFDGEHPTRQTVYTNPPAATELTPARTLYTGNYVLSPQALNYFIPFATLKLRMAGPQLGRIMRAELGSRFVSANLPLLHKRTHDEMGASEFRAGIDKEQLNIDICGEFERQFFGDVMLFSLQSLIEGGYLKHQISDKQIQQILKHTESAMLDRYSDKQKEIMAKLERLQLQLEDRGCWWWGNPDAGDAVDNFRRFMRNMAFNFGDHSPGYGLIGSAQHRKRRSQQILQALLTYKQNRENWQQVLSQIS